MKLYYAEIHIPGQYISGHRFRFKKNAEKQLERLKGDCGAKVDASQVMEDNVPFSVWLIP